MLSSTQTQGVDTPLLVKSLLPLSTGLFFLCVSGVKWYYQLCRPRSVSSSFLNILFSCQLCVMITYSIDFTVSILSNLDSQSPTSTAETMFSGGSLVLWIFVSSATGTSPSLEQQGCWLIYGGVETVFRHLSVGMENQWTVSTASSMIRLSCLYALCSIPFSRATQMWQQRTYHSPDDTCPLPQESNQPGVTDSGTGQSSTTSQDDRDSSAWDTSRYILSLLWPAENVWLQVRLVVLMIWVLLQRWVNFVIPMQQGRTIDQLNQGNGPPLHNIVYFIFWQILESGAPLLQDWISTPLELWARGTLETLGLRKQLELSADFHDNKRSAELWQSVMRGSQAYILFYIIFLQKIPVFIDFCATSFIFPQIFGAQITVIIAVTMAVHLSLHRMIAQRAVLAHKDALSATEERGSKVMELIEHWHVITSFNRIEEEMRNYAELLQKETQRRASARFWKRLQSISELIVLNVGRLSALSLTGYQIFLGKLPLGHFTTLLSYWSQFTRPLAAVAQGFEGVIKEVIDAKKLVELMQTQPTVPNRLGALPLKVEYGRVDFDNVTFGYDDRQRVLEGLTFSCEPGQRIAFVGKTGGGKTTVLRLLCRDYDALSGSIKIDGQEIRDVTIDSLRSAIATVPQQPKMLNLTIMENIRYGNSASDEEIYQVCKDVEIHKELCKIGYDKIVGENGVKLSGGQMQRIALVRAILKDSTILILDEAMSAVDTLTESNIQRNLTPYLQKRTVLIVSHRLATITSADRIFVMEDGQIVQQGTHEQLKPHGLYAQLWAA